MTAACLALDWPTATRARPVEFEPAVGTPLPPRTLRAPYAELLARTAFPDDAELRDGEDDGIAAYDEGDGIVAYDEPLDEVSFRNLLHGCHGRTSRCA